MDDMTNMIANGGWSTPEITSVGKPATNDLDGPAGINSLVSSLKGVSFPSEVIVGSSWNTDLAQRFGTAFGAEAAANHVVGLYAPGMNIHRTPFSGRNFEYYSEDGLLSGKMGAAMVQGVDSQGVYTYIKHFALNDQGSNRLSVSVWANEQSIREIYLKPFELSVKEGGTTAVMNSYSRLGNTWAGASKALLTDVLRNEWGFHGMVVTDSAMGNTNWMDVNLALRAGGDMMLCLMGVKVDSSTNTAQQTMRRACHNILYTQANSIAIAAAVDNAPYWLILLAIVDSILLIAIVLLILKRIPAGKKLGKGAKAGISVGIAAVVALVFWAMFFRSGSAPAAAASSESAAASEPAESTAAPAEEAKDGVFMELSQTDAGGWLGCHVCLMQDGSHTVTYDYNAENTGVEGEKGTYAIGADGALTLTAEIALPGTGAPDPYAGKDLAHYRTAHVQEVPDAEFEALLGRPLPEETTAIDRTMTLGELHHSRSPLCWLIAGVLTLLVRSGEKRGKPNLNILFQYNMPLRGLAQMTGGIIGEETVDGLVMEAKGFWVIGILRALVGLLQNYVANSRYQAKLDEQSR